MTIEMPFTHIRRIFLTSTFLSSVGSAVSLLALGKLFYDRSGDASGFAWAFAAEQCAQVLGLVFAGPLVDRYDPLRMAIAADTLRGVAFLICAVATLFGFWQAALGCALAGGLLKPLHRAALFRWIPSVTSGPHLAAMNGSHGSAMQMGSLLGTGLAGLLLAVVPAGVLVAFDGLTYLFSAFSLRRVAKPSALFNPQIPETPTTLSKLLGIDAWVATIRVVFSNPLLLLRIVLSSGDFLVVAFFNVFLIPYCATVLGRGPWAASLLDGGFAFGAIGVGWLFARFHRAAESSLVYFSAFFATSAAFLALGMSRDLFASLSACVVIGLGSRMTLAVNTAGLQQASPQAHLGRVSIIRTGLVSFWSLLVVAPAAKFVGDKLEHGYLLASMVIFVFLGLATFVTWKTQSLRRKGSPEEESL